MSVNVEIPQIGESINEGILVEWMVEDGAQAVQDQPLFEIETDKVTMAINAPVSGKLTQKAAAGDMVKIGQIVASIDPHEQSDTNESTSESLSEPKPLNISGADTSAGERFTPSVRRMIQEHHVDPTAIAGTGKHGSLTKEDVVLYLEQKKADSSVRDLVQAEPSDENSRQVMQPSSSSQRTTSKPMSPLRKKIAKHLLDAKNNTAMLTTFNEVDMSRVTELRNYYKDTYQKRYGVKLGFMAFFVKAVVDALKTVPQINAYIENDTIIENHFYDVGVAVGTERGLVVPIIRNADGLNFGEIEQQIATLAQKVKEKKISLDELSGGSFTISNGGVYGSLLSTPILNYPQSAILGMHTIKKRPIVIDDQIVIRPMMYLALSYDHRIVDGKDAVTFLKRIVECIETPERMLLEV